MGTGGTTSAPPTPSRCCASTSRRRRRSSVRPTWPRCTNSSSPTPAFPPARTEEHPMSLAPLLLDVLACPEDKGPLLWFEDEDILYNPRLHKSYAVVDGVPVLLADEAVTVDDAEHDRLVAKAEAN